MMIITTTTTLVFIIYLLKYITNLITTAVVFVLCVCLSIFKQRNRRGGGGASDFKCIFIKHIKASTICKKKLAINGMVYVKCVWYFMDFTEVEFKVGKYEKLKNQRIYHTDLGFLLLQQVTLGYFVHTEMFCST